MNRTLRIAAAVAAISLSTAPAIYAAPVIHAPALAMFDNSGVKTVKFNLRNDTGAPMDVQAGDKVVTLAPGKLVGMKLPEGTRIIASTARPNHEVGSLIEQVIKEHSGATIVIR